MLAFLAVLVAANTIVGDTTVWGEWLTVWPALGWLPLLLPALLRYRNWSGLACLLLGIGLLTEWPRLPHSGDGTAPRLRVVVWNVAGHADFLDAIRDLEPDLVLTQESATPPALWPGYAWKAGEDPAVVSRYPIHALETASVGPWAKPLLLRVDTPLGPLLVATARLMHPSVVTQMLDPLGESPARNHARRVQQYPRLMALLQETAQRETLTSWIVAGDFNTPASARSLDPLRAILHDAWTESGVGWGGTAPEFLPLARIDQAWLSSDLHAVEAQVLRRGASDHRLLVVDLGRR